MSKQKKVNYNSCYVNGEVIDVRDARIEGEGQNWEKIKYKMDVEVAENQIVTVEVDKGFFNFDGSEKQQTVGLETICKEVKRKVRDGKGDMVSCNCKIVANEFYSKGELYSQQKLMMDFCNREKADKKIDPGTVWKVHVLIKEIVEREGYIEILGLTNEFMTSKSIKGGYIKFRIYDKEIIDGFNATYKVGDVAPLEGEVKQVNEFKAFDVTKLEDLDMLPETGFGSARNKAIEENKKRAEINKQRAEMREAGGKMVSETYLEITGGNPTLVGEDLAETPFTPESIEEMEVKIESDLNKSKERDIAKNGGDNMPF